MSETQLSPDLFKTKQHFEILDGLRGIAALAVVCFHFMEMAYSDYGQNFIGHGFLAVDFFFCLSGFVIGYAYDSRIGAMGTWEFFKSRMVRLHPLVILSAILGLLAFLFDPFGSQSSSYSAGHIALIFLASILLIPFPSIKERSFNLFSLNAPTWSLFWEYAANIAYALILCRLKRSYLVAVAIIGAAGICYVAFRSGNLMGGWGGSTFWDGSIRVLYSFTAGLLVYRFNGIIKNKLGFIGVGLLLALAFLMPFTSWNWLTEPLVILFYFPFLIALGAGATLVTGLKKLCKFLGNISYPLYMTHYAVIWIFLNYYRSYKPTTAQLALIIISSMFILVTFAYLVMIFYDIPVRRYLARKRKQSSII